MFSGNSNGVLKLSDTKSAFLVHPKSNREEAAAIAYAVRQCCAKVPMSGKSEHSFKRPIVCIWCLTRCPQGAAVLLCRVARLGCVGHRLLEPTGCGHRGRLRLDSTDKPVHSSQQRSQMHMGGNRTGGDPSTMAARTAGGLSALGLSALGCSRRAPRACGRPQGESQSPAR